MQHSTQKTILIVEDDEDTLSWIRLVFLKQGYHVLTADRPEAAWNILQVHGHKIDLAYIDVNYGNKSQQDGFMFAKEIQADPRLHLHYFIMSMDDEDEKYEKAEEVGALGFVEKDESFLVSSLALATEAIYNQSFAKSWGNWKQDDLLFAKRIHSTSKNHRMYGKYWQQAYDNNADFMK